MKKITYYSIAGFKKESPVDLSDYYSSNFEDLSDALEAFENLKNDIICDSIIDNIILFENYDDDTGKAIKRFNKNNFNPFTFGELLKEKREELEMTQQEVADKIGSPLVTYQRWEYNNCSPSAKYLIKLQSALEISADDLEGL